MAPTPGTRLGPYEILGSLGAGGMGEVYRARDSRLDRTVAIKILPAAHASDPEFRSRFDREARAIAALSHPHICTVHDVGRHENTDYLVMELIEGETLARRLERGPLPVDQALSYAIQIADALDRAHRAGIVHRDLKPGNIMITKTGVKLLDFGLAKSMAVSAVHSSASVLPTVAAGVTMQGTIVGTLQYMAPEQVEGAEADARTDIFAFGVVLYEMITGRKAFEGRSPASLMGAILRDQPPPIAALQPLAPRALDRVITTCLAKDPDDRWQSARDLMRELRWLSESSATSGVESGAVVSAAAPRRKSMLLPLAMAAAVCALVTAGAFAWWSSPPALSSDVTRWAFTVPRRAEVPTIAISNDGRLVVFRVTDADGVARLYSRRFDSLEAKPIRGTEGARDMALSPDATWVAFPTGQHLKKVPIAGGTASVICEIAGNFGLHWGASNVVVFGGTAGLSRVDSGGGPPTAITTVDPSQRETAHRWPLIVPGGDAILFSLDRGTTPHVAVVPLAGGTPRIVVQGSRPRLVNDTFLAFSRGQAIWAASVDRQYGMVGEPTPVVDSVTSLLGGYASFDVSAGGTLAYWPRPQDAQRLSWIDRDGRSSAFRPEPFEGIYHGPPALSPDGKRLAVTLHPVSGTDHILIYDLERGFATPIATMSNTTTRWPVWTPDGRLTFASERDGTWDIFEVAGSGTAQPQPLVVAPYSQAPYGWSPSGRLLAFREGRLGDGPDIWIMARDGKPEPFAATPVVVEESAAFGPDERWLVYQSDVSGRAEIYLRPYPGAREPIQVSTTGGRTPMWSPDGRSVLFVGTDDTIFKVPVTLGLAPVVGRPERVARVKMGDDGSRMYTVARDGRVLAIEDISPESPTIVVVQNWIDEIRGKF